MWKDSIRNIVVIFQPNILRIVGFYVRHSANVFFINSPSISKSFFIQFGILAHIGSSFLLGGILHVLHFEKKCLHIFDKTIEV